MAECAAVTATAEVERRAMAFANSMEMFCHQAIARIATGDAACLADEYASAVYDILQKRYEKEEEAKLRRSARIASK